jgi:hypothetical protein
MIQFLFLIYLGVCDNGTFLCVNDPADKCTNVECNGTACVRKSITCPTPDACQTGVCDPSTGTCTYSVKSCDDSLPCTTDSCDPVRGCQHVPITCPTPSSPCNEVLPCDPTTGELILNEQQTKHPPLIFSHNNKQFLSLLLLT